jgi:hypothetical protein
MSMTTRITSVTVEVQDRGLAFYRDILGCEVRADVEVWPGARWLEVAPPGSQVGLALLMRASGLPLGARYGTADADDRTSAWSAPACSRTRTCSEPTTHLPCSGSRIPTRTRLFSSKTRNPRRRPGKATRSASPTVLRLERRSHPTPRYLISFDDGSMDHIPDDDWPAVAEARRST